MRRARIESFIGMCCVLVAAPVRGQAPPPPPPSPPVQYAQPQQQYAQQPTQVYLQPQPAAPAPTYAQPAAVAPCPDSQLPSTLPYREGPTPKGYVLEDSSLSGLWITGTALLGSAYLISIFAAGPSRNDGTEALYAPIIGPWITVGQCTTCDDGQHSALVLDGLTQVAGAVMIVLGVVIRDKKFVRSYEELALTVTPRPLGIGGHGIGLVGRF